MQRKLFKTALFIAVFFIANALSIYAQVLQPIKWSFSTKDLGNNEVVLIMKATIDEGWHLYAQDFPEGGPIPLWINFEKSENYELVGKTIESPKAIEEFDKIFNVDVKYFKHSATFTQKIKVLANKNFAITGAIDGQACVEGKCIPVMHDIEFEIKVKPEKAGQTASPSEGNADKNVVPIENSDKAEENENTADTISTEINNAELQEMQEANSSTQIEESVTKEVAEVSLWSVIIEAILWGFAAILTPCVFPMVPMTVSFFMKGSKNKAKGRVMASSYGLSIIGLYTFPIAVIIFITYLIGGEAVTGDIFNWLSTHWLPNIIFFLIFMIFAASFFGAFEIVLPSWMVNKADAQADKGGFIGTFFMALTLVLVSFSCTGPIVGSIIVKSTQGEIWQPIITMLAFSTAFALPFTLFAFFPSLLNNLPQSGGWLNSVKVVLGFIEVALGFKFLSVADQVYHWGILDREVYLAIWIVTFSLLGLYFLGKLKFRHDSDFKHLTVTRLGLALLTFSFVVYMIPGMFGAPLKMLSGYMPPSSTHDFDINKVVRDNISVYMETGNVQQQNSAKTELCESPKFADFLHLPHGLTGYFDYDQAMKCAIAQNKPLFIDFTGHGCVNCREMEANVWSDPEVIKRLRRDYVIVALYVDDKTELPENEWIVSTVDGKTKKTLGKKFADLQIAKYNTNAQPYYCLLDHKGELLVTPRAYNFNIDEFVNFLDKGVEEFINRSSK